MTRQTPAVADILPAVRAAAADADECRASMRAKDSPFARRMWVRAYFAWVEVVCFSARQQVLERRFNKRVIRPADIPEYLKTAVMCGLILARAGPAAEAQDVGVARSFEQLQLLVRPGHSVRVTDTTGTEFSGRIGRLSDVSLVLQTDGSKREWWEADIRVIRQRRSDPLGNGALIGLGFGAG